MIDVESAMRKKKSFKTQSIMLFIGSLYLGMAVGHTSLYAEVDEALGEPNIFVILTDTLEGLAENPFAIFPTTIGSVAFCLFVALFAWSLLYQSYLENKRLMPGMENGTAEFETDFNRFYKKYLYDPKIILHLKKQTFGTALCAKLFFNRTYRDNRTGTTYMRRSFALKEEIKECRDNAFILSDSVYLSINTKFTQRNLNVLVLGGSGTGKSRYVVKPNILQANSSFVVTDPSGDIMAETADFLEKKKGYKIVCFNIQDMLASNRYNPFHYVKCNEDIPIMINCLMKNTDNGKSGGDPFWDRSETALLCACCGYLFEARPESERNFANVMKMLRMVKIDENGKSDKKNDLDLLFEDWESKYPESFAVKNYKTFKMAPGKTALSILITAGVRLGTFFDLEKVANLTSYDEMELEEIGKRKTALFIVTPQGDTTYSFLVSMLYTQLFETLYKVGEEKGKKTNGDVSLDVPVRCLIDEFANVGKIPDFEIKLATMRKYNISACPVLQSLAQLKTMYEKEWEGIMGNCDTILFLGGTEPSTLEALSKRLGKSTINTRNISKNYSKGGGGSVSKQSAGRELMMAEEIGMMDNSQCLIFIRGCKPFCTRKYPYQTHPNYKFTAEKDSRKLYKITVKNIETKKIDLFENTSYEPEVLKKTNYEDINLKKLNINNSYYLFSANGNKALMEDGELLDINIKNLKGENVYDNLFKPKSVSEKGILNTLNINPLMLEMADSITKHWEEIERIFRNHTLLVDHKDDYLAMLENTIKKNRIYDADALEKFMKLCDKNMKEIIEIVGDVIPEVPENPSLVEMCEALDIDLTEKESQQDIKSNMKNNLLYKILVEAAKRSDSNKKKKKEKQENRKAEAEKNTENASEEKAKKTNNTENAEPHTNDKSVPVITNDVEDAKKILGNDTEEITLKNANSEPVYEFELPNDISFNFSNIVKEEMPENQTTETNEVPLDDEYMDYEEETNVSSNTTEVDVPVYKINGEFVEATGLEVENEDSFYDELEKRISTDDEEDNPYDDEPDDNLFDDEPEDSMLA